MSVLSKAWKKNYPGIKEAWGELRESEGGVGIIASTLGAVFAPLAAFAPFFKKETSPGSGVYETDLINPASVAFAGVVGLLVYVIVKKKK